MGFITNKLLFINRVLLDVQQDPFKRLNTLICVILVIYYTSMSFSTKNKPGITYTRLLYYIYY
jgi:hypothetical protein